jgi:hypothetical protein
MKKVQIRAVIKYLCKKGILEDFMDTLRKEFHSYSTVGILRGAGRELKLMNGLCGQKRPPTMKLPKLYTILSCATEGETCEALLGKWV